MKPASILLAVIGLSLSLCLTSGAQGQTLQTQTIDLKLNNTSLKEVFAVIQRKFNVQFIYNDKLIAAHNNISVNIENKPLTVILDEVLMRTNLKYKIQDDKIIITEKESKTASPAAGAVKPQTIRGTILEAGTNKRLSNVNVYFDGTSNIIASDSLGNFTLHLRGTNKTPFVVSAIGYNPETINDYPTNKRMIIYIQPRQIGLDAVEITASDGIPRNTKLRLFKQEFLGTLGNNCEILNEDDIRLYYNLKTSTLTASSDKPIIVHNKSLGYTFHFVLEKFVSVGRETSFFGTRYSTDDQKPANNRILKARQRTYLGSGTHFIKSLWNNELEKNNFKIFTEKGKKLPYDSIVVSYGGQKYLRLKDTIMIEYQARRTRSFVWSNPPGRDVYIDKDGYYDPMALTWDGYIGKQRASDLLPLEYNNDPVAPPSRDIGIQGIAGLMDTLRNVLPAEKLYIQFDKPYYSTGDTLWLKAYLLDAAFLSPSQQSGIVYLELANDTNKVMMRRMMHVASGLGRGNLVLNKDEVPEGSYTLRAYTNLMRNFGEDLVFKKSFYVSGTGSWLVNSDAVLTKQSGRDNVRLAMQFSQLNRQRLGLHELDIRVRDGKKVLFRDKLQTDVQGGLDVNFDLPEGTDPRNISLVAADLVKDREDHKITIPVPVDRPENMDLQFMPEGGNLVAGITSQIGFKAVGEDGRGTKISGKVLNSRNEQVASFSSSHKGMGSFELTPRPGESYVAKVALPGEITKDYPLPAIKSTGTALQIVNLKKSDSLEIRVMIPPVSGGTYYLAGQARSVICYGATIRESGVKRISKSLFPTGIVKFSLISASQQPLNERLVFVNQHDNLNISLSPAKGLFETRDSVALKIEVKDHDGNPVQGSFSLAVTDDSQVKKDSLESNILTYLLLSSDLKGTVEEPAYYFGDTEQAWSDLDNLMLTQGWAGYDWKDVFNMPVPEYEAEQEFKIRGRISNVFNKPVGGTSIQLYSGKPAFVRDGLSNKDGSFEFSGFPHSDTLKFFLQARNKNEKSFNIGLTVEEFKPPLFAQPARLMPWYMNSDSSLLKYVSTAAQQQQARSPGENILSEVTITAKKIIKGSRNLNGVGNADIVLDEKDIDKGYKMNLYELLVKRFKYVYLPSTRFPYYRLTDNRPIVLFIDGEPNTISAKGIWGPAAKLYMDNLTADDIRGIEIMSAHKYLGSYFPGRSFFNAPVILEITTWSGNGIFLKNKPGTYLHKPMPFTGSKQFYSPKYSIKNPAGSTPDLRSTIYWDPDFITDSSGRATVSFYSSDRSGTYSVIMEGTDLDGKIGRQTGRISIR